MPLGSATRPLKKARLNLIINALSWFAEETSSLDRIRRCLAFRAPAECLPVEILCEIFAWYCLPSDPLDCIDPREGPMVLSSVCRRWRDVATSYGKLWADIGVLVGADGSTPGLPLIDMWLKRSNTTPLAIAITQKFPRESSFSAVIPVLLLLRPHLVRTKTFLFLFHPNSSMGVCELPTFQDQTTCPLLRRAALATNNLSHREMAWLSTLLFSRPQLSHAYWESQHCLDQVMWEHLHSLVLNPGSLYLPREWTNVLPRCGKNLRQLRLYAFSQPGNEGYGAINLPNLELMVLRSDLPFGDTLDCFTSPKLQTLGFTPHEDFRDIPSQQWPQPQFRRFIFRSSCMLTRLILSDTRIPDEELSECLALLSSLSDLNILCTTVSMDVSATLKLLTPPISTIGQTPRQCLCPNLTAIALWKCGLGEDGLFGKMVARRLTLNCRDDGGIAQLQSVDVAFVLALEVLNLHCLVACEAQGVVVVVRPSGWSPSLS